MYVFERKKKVSITATLQTVTELTGACGKDITIECTPPKSPQHGVYMYRKERASKLKEIVYVYKDKTLTNKEINKSKVDVSIAFPNLNVTILNVTLNDAGLYWCEYNLEEKITPSKLTLLWIGKFVLHFLKIISLKHNVYCLYEYAVYTGLVTGK